MEIKGSLKFICVTVEINMGVQVLLLIIVHVPIEIEEQFSCRFFTLAPVDFSKSCTPEDADLFPHRQHAEATT